MGELTWEELKKKYPDAKKITVLEVKMICQCGKEIKRRKLVLQERANPIGTWRIAYSKACPDKTKLDDGHDGKYVAEWFNE